MSVMSPLTALPSPIRVPFAVQLIAWLLGLVACFAGMINLIAEWNMEMATVQFLLLVIAPVVWMIERRRAVFPTVECSQKANDRLAWIAVGLVGLTSWTTCFLVGRDLVEMPPAFHDEYSYLFQAKTLLLGRFTVPSHPTHPEFFDQMHVLNEGRMASRYYPGTGLWLAPFVAMKHPYWGHWLASALASMFVFWTGWELGGLRVAVISGFVCALSPGIALFANLLLAHQPTLLALCVFIWAFVKWQRTRNPREACIAGCGLSFAMLCRPATAAGMGLPFGIAMLHWLAISRDEGQIVNWVKRLRVLIAMGIPLVIGWSVMLAYNQSVTGSWRSSPYQLYTEIYTPRHVYGFDNVRHGEQKVGPKVIDSYDRWASNLTPELAAKNVCDRWLSSWIWTFDVLPLLLCTVVALGMAFRLDRRWMPIGFAVLSLHAIHVPYWYSGIMGWHYVFESAPIWCLVVGLATDRLFSDWRASGRWLMSTWWTLLLLTSLAGDYLPFRSIMRTSSITSRISRGVRSIEFSRRRYADFDQWLNAAVTKKPAIVLIETEPDEIHIDYVVNSPSLADPILRARDLGGASDVKNIVEAFPDRFVYLCSPKLKSINLLNLKSLQ